MSESKFGVEAVDRALAILRSFSDTKQALSLTQISEQTGLYKSTVLRLTESLAAASFLRRGEDKLFRPGPELWRLGTLYRRSLDLGPLIRPALEKLVQLTGETASFYVRDGEARLCLYRHNSPRAIRHHLDEGTRLPLGQGAAGRVLVAFNLRNAAPDPVALEQGYCVSLGERDPEVAAVAVPVIDRSGHLRGALSVSGVLTRFGEQERGRAIAALKEEAEAIKAILPVED